MDFETLFGVILVVAVICGGAAYFLGVRRKEKQSRRERQLNRDRN